MHHIFMQRCLELARMGKGSVATNPMVGCVIVHKEKIIGEGYHKQFGKPHAEVNAVNSVKDKSLLKNSRLYVSLEPCCHYGKTPPCTDLILKHKIPEVIIGSNDPFERINGSGEAILKKNGVKIISGILEKECRMLNRRFHVFHEKKRPYIILKWAQTKDGFIAPLQKNKPEPAFRISNDYSQMFVHKWRSQESSIMVGTNTAENDNPQLTVRNWQGNNPVRIVVDKNLRLPPSLHLFDEKVKTIVFTSKEKKSTQNLLFSKIDFAGFPETALSFLHASNLQSVLIEGGNILLNTFINANLWDEAHVFTSEKNLDEGIPAPTISKKPGEQSQIFTDTLTVYHN